MLERLTVHDFKSLQDVTVELPRVAVFFGPNAAGKSNLLDAIQLLSRIGTERTLMDCTRCWSDQGVPDRSVRATQRRSRRAAVEIHSAVLCRGRLGDVRRG